MMNEDPESIRRLHYCVMTCPSLMAMAYAVSLGSVTRELLLDLVDHFSPRDKKQLSVAFEISQVMV